MIKAKSFKACGAGSWRYFLGFILVFSLSSTIASSQDQVIVSLAVGECNLSLESNEKWNTLRLRAHHPQYKGCHIDKEAMLSVLSAGFSKTESPKLGGHYSSLSLGRLIDYHGCANTWQRPPTMTVDGTPRRVNP